MSLHWRPSVEGGGTCASAKSRRAQSMMCVRVGGDDVGSRAHRSWRRALPLLDLGREHSMNKTKQAGLSKTLHPRDYNENRATTEKRKQTRYEATSPSQPRHEHTYPSKTDRSSPALPCIYSYDPYILLSCLHLFWWTLSSLSLLLSLLSLFSLLLFSLINPSNTSHLSSLVFFLTSLSIPSNTPSSLLSLIAKNCPGRTCHSFSRVIGGGEGSSSGMGCKGSCKEEA